MTFLIILGMVDSNQIYDSAGRWPNVPNFCLGPSEISRLWTLVAQIYLFSNSK